MSSDDFDSSPSPTTKEHAPLFVAPLPASQRGFCFRALFVGLLIAVVVGVVVGVAVGLTTRGLPADPLERAKVQFFFVMRFFVFIGTSDVGAHVAKHSH